MLGSLKYDEHVVCALDGNRATDGQGPLSSKFLETFGGLQLQRLK